VRKEGSGSTSILKKFLFEINNKTLSDGETWNKSAEGSSNTNWPEKSTDLKEAEKGSGVTAEVESVPGTIGYANLNEVREKPAFGKAPNGSEFWPLLESKGKKYADPSTDEEQTTPANANCAAEEYISLNGVDKQEKFPPASTEDVWNEVTASTVQKKSYPLCGFTYDLALTEYTLFSAASEGAEEDAEPTTAPEVETLKNYLTFVLDEGQKLVGEKHDFYPLPEGKKGGNVLAVARAGLAKIGF
jgi:ABC-type phosphate transport system substrate-binding protein